MSNLFDEDEKSKWWKDADSASSLMATWIMILVLIFVSIICIGIALKIVMWIMGV